MNTKASLCLLNTTSLISSRHRLISMSLLLITLCFSLTATADPKGSGQRQGFDAQQSNESRHSEKRPPQNFQQKAISISPQQAVSIAKQRQPGKVLSVKRNNGYYKVKMLHEGKVRYVKVNAH
ncbi:PepSY domain-containing protein [Pseudomaricurvus sp.]|uniref:PepSY domain-containing protein n=1 Tax=Pseudomaricurvus sp. TaxID=2004510 RepID=UPI003F6A8E46